MSSIWDLANSHLRALNVYEPGKPIEETARQLGVDPRAIIKLASNENPLGPSPKAIKSMQTALKTGHLYPDGAGFYLCDALARKLGISKENIVLGNGSNEIIEFLGHAFLTPGAEVITPEYSFICYKLIATLFGATIVETPAPDFKPDLDAILDAIGPNTKIVFIANPNNPTGALVSPKQIDSFVSRVPGHVVVVFDEAYYEFIDKPADILRHIRERPNIMLLRTFSKIHGLASLRIGYGIGARELIEILHKTRQPFNVNGVALAGALTALDDTAYQRSTKRVIDAGRAYLEKQFAKMKLRFVPSVANFVMVNVGDGPAIFRKLLAKKIIVRPLKGYGLPEWVRISVGTMEQNRKCIAALKEVLKTKMS